MSLTNLQLISLLRQESDVSKESQSSCISYITLLFKKCSLDQKPQVPVRIDRVIQNLMPSRGDPFQPSRFGKELLGLPLLHTTRQKIVDALSLEQMLELQSCDAALFALFTKKFVE